MTFVTFTQRKWRRTCVTFKQRKLGQFHSQKGPKRCGSPNKIRVMYEIKENKEVGSFRKSENSLFESHRELSETVPLEN